MGAALLLGCGDLRPTPAVILASLASQHPAWRYPPAEVLIVQDDHAEALMAVESFTDNKLLNTVTVIDDGDRAIQYLRRQGAYTEAARPDLVILDLRLPRLDGSTVLRSIRNDAALARLVVAVLGSDDVEGRLLRLQGVTADAYLDRPVTFEHVVRLVRQTQHLGLMVVRRTGSVEPS